VCHIGGLANAKCSQCHGAAVDDGTAFAGQPGVAGSNVFPNISGSHSVHMSKVASVSCSSTNSCHSGFGSGSIKHGFKNTTTSSHDKMAQITQPNGRIGFAGTFAAVTWTPATNSCANTCHGSGAVWGGRLKCVDCHSSTQPTTAAHQALGAPATRRDIVAEFANTWSHKRSATVSGTVVDEDCIVCHMEGDATTHGKTAVHGDGYINLRDPDTGLNIKNVTHNGSATAAGVYTAGTTDVAPVSFKRDLSVRFETDPNWLITAAMEQNLCLKCHDANGALSSSAWVTGGSALKPFATTITGHAAPFNSNGTGNVVNVAKSYVSTNGAYHPVVSKANNSYTQGTKMVAPWNGVTKTTGNNTQYGSLMACWDCHAPPGATGAQVATVTAHGAAITLRAPIRAGGATAALNLCIVCHATTYATTGNNHGTGSAFGAGGSSMSSNSTFVNCFYCHGYNGAVGASVVAASTRPNRAEDVHGTDDRTAGTAASRWTSGAKPFAFIRNTLSDWRPASATGVTFAGTLTSSQCLGTGGTCNNNMSSRTYTPGGAY
jgi:hypothetical protein